MHQIPSLEDPDDSNDKRDRREDVGGKCEDDEKQGAEDAHHLKNEKSLQKTDTLKFLNDEDA
jgi:hypothetical protein